MFTGTTGWLENNNINEAKTRENNAKQKLLGNKIATELRGLTNIYFCKCKWTTVDDATQMAKFKRQPSNVYRCCSFYREKRCLHRDFVCFRDDGPDVTRKQTNYWQLATDKVAKQNDSRNYTLLHTPYQFALMDKRIMIGENVLLLGRKLSFYNRYNNAT